MTPKVLVTGSCGFIFSNFIIYALQETKWDLVSIDKLTYAGSLYNISHNSNVFNKRHKFYLGDVCDKHFINKVFEMEKPDIVIHGAAESVRGDTLIPYKGSKKIEHIEIQHLWNRFKKKNEIKVNSNNIEFINLSGKQRALTWKNGFGQWRSIKQISRHKYNGKMIHMRQKWGEIDVTPNHCIYNSNMDLVTPSPNQELLSIRTIKRSHSEKDTVKNFGHFYWNTSLDDYLYMIAFYMTRGWAISDKVNNEYFVKFCQNKKEDIARIKYILKNNFNPSMYICDKECNSVIINNKKVFENFVKECGYSSDNKKFPNDIFCLKPEYKKKFIEYLVYFNNNYTKTNKKYYTNSRILAAQLSTLLSMVKQDYSYSKNIHDEKNSTYCFQLSNIYNSVNKPIYEEYYYDGWVYDIEIDDTHKFACGLGNVIVHNSHVDNSINNANEFVKTNVLGTHSVLEAALHVHTPQKFINISCYDQNTRALTSKGLKYFYELEKNDIVFTINPNTMCLEEQPIDKIITQSYNGNMIMFKKSGVDALLTPNHRVYDENMKVFRADECIGHKTIKFPKPHGYKGKRKESIVIDNREVNTKSLFYLIGMYLKYGSIVYQEKNIQSKSTCLEKTYSSKGRKVFFDIPENYKTHDRIEKILSNLNINYTKQNNKSRLYVCFTSEFWANYFGKLGKHIHNKYIPGWMMKYDSEILQYLFDGLIGSDISFTTTSNKLRDNISELAVKLGMFPNINKKDFTKYSKDRENGKHYWQITFSKGRNKQINNNSITNMYYDGKVWCIKVKNKNLLVERNGKYMFSGNTDEVYGSIENGSSLESDPLQPRSPYCVTPDTKILLKNGKEVCISDLNKDDDIVSIDYLNLSSPSSLVTAQCMRDSKPTNIFKKKYNGDIIEINTNHCNLNCTPEHVLFIRRPRRLGKNKIDYRQDFSKLPVLEIPASEIKVGDWLICARKVEFKGKKTLGDSFWRFAGYFTGDGSVHKNYGGRNSKHIRLADSNKELLQKYKDIIVNITFDNVLYDQFNTILGLDDESLKKFCDNENISLHNARRWAKGSRKPVFCAHPSFFKHTSKNCWYLKFGHKKTVNIIEELKLNAKASEKEIPDILFNSTNNEIASFLAGLFDSDGTILNGNRKCSKISYSSASFKLLNDIKALFRRFGIISTISAVIKNKYKWYNLIISDNSSVKIFKNKIPVFKHRNKIKCNDSSQKNLYGKDIYHSIVRGVNVKHNICNEVYDIENAQHHNFIASGVVVHNSSTKASADLLGYSYYITHNIPVITTRCSNNFGPRQHIEKLIPKTITNVLMGKKIPLYGDGKNSREWIYVKDNFSALVALVEKGIPGESYNISSGFEKRNIEVIRSIFNILGKGEGLLEYVKDRPGHDRRYSVNCTKITKHTGWIPSYSFENALAHTVGWYKANGWFWKKK